MVLVSLYSCCCWLLDGLVCMVLLRWVVSITPVSVVLGSCWITVCSYYLLSSNRDESFQKEKTSSVFLPREARQNRGTCVCLFCFLSKNENNNGFDIICLNSSPFDYKRVANIYFTVVFRIVFPGCFVLDWMRNLHNEHHLAAKNGTFSAC